MFDPANNPFAIQHLLKKEEDDTFLAKRDERPNAIYAESILLKQVKVQPVRDFQLNELLDQPLPEVKTFSSEADEPSSTNAVLHASPDEHDEPPAVHATEDIIQHTEADHTSSEEQSLSIQASGADEASSDTAQKSTENISTDIAAYASDSVELAELAEQEDGLSEQVALAQEPALEQAAHQAAFPSVDATEAIDSNEHDHTTETQSSSEETELPAGAIAADTEADSLASVDTSDETVMEQAEPELAAGLDNEAVHQLIEAAREQARVEAHAAGFQEGLEAGLEQAKLAMQATIDEKLAVIDQVMKGLHQLERDPDALFEPMKKLAMHLAQQLVRGELTQSGQVIARLVDNCLRELAASGEKAVIIHLHPDDLEQYKPLTAQFGDSIVLRPDGLLSRGSVRASLDGSVVEDMIERRVKGLSKSLAQPVASSWRPALPATSAKPKSTVAAQPAPTATPATSIKADELDHDHGDDDIVHDNDDDAMIDAMIDASTMVSSDQIHADRNDETNS